MKQHSDSTVDKTAKSQEQELSMEEILASIRRIVTEDPADDAPTKGSSPQEDGVIELTQMLQDDGGVVDLRDSEKASVEKVPTEKTPTETTSVSDLPAPTAAPQPRAYSPAYPQAPSQQTVTPSAVEKPTEATTERDVMISNQIAETISKKMARLAETNAQMQQATQQSNMTLEALTRDIIRPFLYDWLEKNFEPLLTKLMKSWLENNLPDMVERVVNDEIRKITTTPDEL